MNDLVDDSDHTFYADSAYNSFLILTCLTVKGIEPELNERRSYPMYRLISSQAKYWSGQLDLQRVSFQTARRNYACISKKAYKSYRREHAKGSWTVEGRGSKDAKKAVKLQTNEPKWPKMKNQLFLDVPVSLLRCSLIIMKARQEHDPPSCCFDYENLSE